MSLMPRSVPKGTETPIIEDLHLPCPLSGYRFDGKMIATHMMIARRCRGDVGIFAVCNPHMVRVFINEPTVMRRHLSIEKQKS